MGFGNGAFQAARIAIDGVTIVQNIITGKIQATGVTIPNTTSNSYLVIPVANTQNVATPAPFQQLVQLNLSQYPQLLQGIASDLSNVYFSSDEEGQNKLYSWRESPASLTSDVTWWVLLPNGIPANGTVIIYLQVSNSTALDGVYTGEAPQLSSTYGQYDNGAKVFTNYYNFAGTSLPSGWTSSTAGSSSVSVNNGISISSDNLGGNVSVVSNIQINSTTVVDEYITSQSTSFGQDMCLVSSSSSTSFSYQANSVGFQNGSLLEIENNNGGTPSVLASTNVNVPVVVTVINNILYANYNQIASINTQILANGYLALSANTAYHASFSVQWLRTRAYPPNGVMPSLQTTTAQAVQAIMTSTSNTWNAPQVFLSGLVDVNPTYAYVANVNSQNVSVINTTTNKVDAIVGTSPVGIGPVSVAITPNGKYAYVGSLATHNVLVINTSTNTVVATISVGGSPQGIAITPDGNYAYVANFGNVSVIDTSTNKVVTTISVGGSPVGIAITPNGKYAYVSNAGSGTVSVINIATNTVVNTITVGTSPWYVAITPDGLYAYVANAGSGTVSVINTSNNTVVSTIGVGSDPTSIAITPNGKYAYVSNFASGTVSVINIATNTVVNTITVGSGPDGIAISPNGLYAYVTNYISGTVSVINTSNNTVVSTIGVGINPYGVAVAPYFYTATQIAPYLSGFQQNTSTPQTTLTGSTAGSITYSMPTAEGAYKKFVAYASGYENDTTTAQTISFPVAFTNTPYVVTAPSSLISNISTTGITLASGTTTTYTGWIIIEGY
jgi:YVTN family beta-propeller protein